MCFANKGKDPCPSGFAGSIPALGVFEQKMGYKKKDHRRNIINGITSSFIVAVFIGVLYDTDNWLIALFVSLFYAIFAYYVSWFLVKDKKK